MNIDFLKQNNLIIFECIAGSHAYGTNLPHSDKDIRGIFILPEEAILGFGYVEQINDDKNDVVYYEIRRFLELVESNNPNILEVLNSPEDCILYKHPVFDLILAHKDEFLTQRCRESFSGYAIGQIRRARGLNKKIVNPIDKKKKTPLDFCYYIDKYNSIPINEWLAEQYKEQKFCGLAKVSNTPNLYAVFYDYTAHNCFSIYAYGDKELMVKDFREGKFSCEGYKGIVLENEEGEFLSNDLRLSSIPKNAFFLGLISYNKDAYIKYCKEYTQYWEWVEKRNPERYAENIEAGKGYDGKNMAHCMRLLEMSLEILKEGKVNVRRPNREELLSIRRGEMEYDYLVESANSKIEEIERVESKLPEKIEEGLLNDLLVNLRKEFYYKNQHGKTPGYYRKETCNNILAQAENSGDGLLT